MINKQFLIGWLLILAGSNVPVFSSEGYSSHGAHVHGEAALYIVLDENTLSIELDSPAINLIGFEHEPNNEEQKSAILNAKQTLVSADRLFHFSTTQCSLENVEIEVPYINKHENKNHQHHHHETYHDHADFHASYIFQCEQAKDPVSISIKLFSLFPGLQEIKAQWIFQDKQGSASLTASDPTLSVN
ncbi:DUF2796 domain-containing protein [Nitrosomonas sp. Is37]|uniref:DUF2796 domain-containing protein n=1 Tax=Nitrosomonas sp. Is37 TaxID=3080535 RepID=UPI00294AF8A3|nr:DUF2796 domain-containing protein [Nitrosomonas sp. Is37]MDV6345735.1 DUF2796 domain-containing protein [Nitrosomonas sp. Is37]